MRCWSKIALSAGPKGTFGSKSAIFAGQKNHRWHAEASGASGSGHGRAATCLTVQQGKKMAYVVGFLPSISQSSRSVQ